MAWPLWPRRVPTIFAYCGIGCAIAAQATRRQPAGAAWRRLSTIGSGLADLALPLIGFAPIYGLPALHGTVPTRWTDFTPISSGVLMAALALTVASDFHSPAPARATPAAGTPRVGAPADRIERRGLSGLPYLLVHEYLWTLGVVAVLGIGATLVILFAAHIRTPHEVVAFIRMELARLDGTALPPGEGADPFAVVVLFACFAATIAARYPAMMRHLRVLPLGADRLQTLLIAWPTAVWLSAWILFIALHSLFLGEPPRSMHLPAFIAVAGISALVVALSLRQSGPQHAIAFSSLFVLVPMLLFVGFPPAPALVAIGLAGFSTTIALNRAALRRNSTYRHSGMPIALPLTR